MACSGCEFENHEGTRFCTECGTPLAVRCPACDADAAPGQKFCGACGTALTLASSPSATVATAARKTVTVLFADLGGSTGFGERTDAEVSRQVLARYHALLQETIDAHGGTVAKFMGDGMMATFGIPEVAEDDARRAVATGSALQAAFEDFAADVERTHGEALTLRVGINTGEVVVSDDDADLVGDALNVAARLEKACRPGHVLVGEETWRLTRGNVAYESLGEVTVTGRAQPVAIYEVADADLAPEVTAPFVGRNDEVERLLAVFEGARRSAAARLVTVLGSPGVGKTRLSRELCARLAAEDDARSFELRCDRAGEATFAPVAQLIRAAAGLADDLDADATRAALRDLLSNADTDRDRVVDALAGLVGVGPGRSVEETFWGVRRLVEATAADRPVVVVIDDIQWAEPLLLDLIEHLADWVAGAAVLIVALARPELREVRPSLAEPGRPVSVVLVLDGLDASATEALAAGLLGTDRLPRDLVDRLPASTDGNPLFVRELVRMLVDDGVIRQGEDGVWELAIDAEAVDVPPTIQSLLGARIERLPEGERQLLEHASVIGAEFSLGALRELAGESTPITSPLDAMRRKELVESTGTYLGDEPVYRFHHVLIHDAVYRRLLKATRAERHEQVAVWTDRTAVDLMGEHEAATAFHYEQAHRYRSELGERDARTHALGRRAAELLTTAAERAIARDDLASAGGLALRALALAAPDDAARADLLRLASESLLGSGDIATATPLVDELERRAGDESGRAWADCYAAQLVALTDPDGLVAAEARARAAAKVLAARGDRSGEAKAHQVRAEVLGRLGRIGEAELELDDALAAARAADDRRRVTEVLGAAPDAALFGPSPVARAGGRCLDVVRLLRITTASPSVEAASHRCQAVLEALRGRFDVSRSMIDVAREAQRELGLRHGLAKTELYAGIVELIAGDPGAALAPLRAAVEGLGALGVAADAGNAAALLARAVVVGGDVDEADELATSSEQLAGQNLQAAIGWRVARAEVLAARGEHAEAVAVAEEAVEIAAGTDLLIDHADACAALAALRERAGDAVGAQTARTAARQLYVLKGATAPAAGLAEGPASSARGEDGVPRRDSSTREIANSATRSMDRFPELARSGRFDAMADLIAEEYVRVDHRRVPAPSSEGPEGFVAILRATLEVGFDDIVNTPLAVRGEQLALSRVEVRSSDGREIVFLQVHEWDASTLVYAAHYDEDDLVAAEAELDDRYLAQEATDHHDLLRRCIEHLRLFQAQDFDALRERLSPDFVWVDHRELSWGALDADGWIAQQLTYQDLRHGYLTRTLHVSGQAVLATMQDDATTPDGTRAFWVFHTVALSDLDGRTARMEIFAEDDWDAALARFDDLSRADPRHPRADNTASRVWARVMAAVDAGDDEALAAMYAPGFRHEDRRRIVSYGEHDRAGAAELLSISRRSGQRHDPPSVVAVRGERLALTRIGSRDPGGYEIATFCFVEIDGHDRVLRTAIVDPDDLAAAIDELDTRFMAGEGAAHAAQMRVGWATWMAIRDGDVDTLGQLLAPDLVTVDHQRIGFGTGDRGSFLDVEEVNREVFTHGPEFIRTCFLADHAILGVYEAQRIDRHGGTFEWVSAIVGHIDASDRVDRIEWFDLEDWDAALARFDELATTPGAVTNASTTALDRLWTAASEQRFDDAAALLAPDIVRTDHRTGVSSPPVRGADEYVQVLRAAFDRGEVQRVVVNPVAVRGEQLALCRLEITALDFELLMLLLAELDDAGRLSSLAVYDVDDPGPPLHDLEVRFASR